MHVTDVILRWIGRISMAIVMLALSPLLLVLMMLDIKRLTAAAEAVEPLRPGEQPPQSKLGQFARMMVLIIALPVVCLVGGFLWIMGDDDDDCSLL